MSYSNEYWEKIELKAKELGVPFQNDDGTYKSALEWLQEVSDKLYGSNKEEQSCPKL